MKYLYSEINLMFVSNSGAKLVVDAVFSALASQMDIASTVPVVFIKRKLSLSDNSQGLRLAPKNKSVSFLKHHFPMRFDVVLMRKPT